MDPETEGQYTLSTSHFVLCAQVFGRLTEWAWCCWVPGYFWMAAVLARDPENRGIDH